MIKNFCEFGLDVIVANVLERPFKNGVKTVDQRSPSVKILFTHDFHTKLVCYAF